MKGLAAWGRCLLYALLLAAAWVGCGSELQKPFTPSIEKMGCLECKSWCKDMGYVTCICDAAGRGVQCAT